MGVNYFDKSVKDTRIGHAGQSDYVNHYGPWVVGIIQKTWQPVVSIPHDVLRDVGEDARGTPAASQSSQPDLRVDRVEHRNLRKSPTFAQEMSLIPLAWVKPWDERRLRDVPSFSAHVARQSGFSNLFQEVLGIQIISYVARWRVIKSGNIAIWIHVGLVEIFRAGGPVGTAMVFSQCANQC